jgi:hypothetical protein
MIYRGAAFAALVGCVVQPVCAAPKVVIQPIQLAEESIRYNHGVATVDQFSDTGSIQIRPAPVDHGSLAFNIAVFNTGSQAANIDVSNFTLAAGSVTVNAMSVEVLEKKAKSRAAWTQFGLAMLGAASAAAAASQRDTYHSTFVTPRGRTYHSYYSAPSALGQATAVASVAAAGVGIAAVQNRLDQTLEALGTDIVQLTTVDPDDSYGGTIVFEKVKFAKLPMQVTMTVDWNGRKYPFTFQIAKPGTPAPAFKPTPIVEQAPAASQSIAPASSESAPAATKPAPAEPPVVTTVVTKVVQVSAPVAPPTEPKATSMVDPNLELRAN